MYILICLTVMGNVYSQYFVLSDIVIIDIIIINLLLFSLLSAFFLLSFALSSRESNPINTKGTEMSMNRSILRLMLSQLSVHFYLSVCLSVSVYRPV